MEVIRSLGGTEKVGENDRIWMVGGELGSQGGKERRLSLAGDSLYAAHLWICRADLTNDELG